MSTTPKDTARETANQGSQKAGTAPVGRSANPARPSKFAGLNLRQRSSEQSAAEPEPVPPSYASPDRDREQQATHLGPCGARSST